VDQTLGYWMNLIHIDAIKHVQQGLMLYNKKKVITEDL
jgi:hypothetical protein